MNILMVYHSYRGSSAEIAQRLADVLKDRGHDVALHPVSEQPDVTRYDAVVMGAPIHTGMWSTPMTLYLRKICRKITNMPVYCWFTSIRIIEPDGLDHALTNYLPTEINYLSNLRDIKGFAGKLMMNELDWEARWMLYVRYDGRQMLERLQGDFRDWKDIQQWGHWVADDLANTI